MSGVFRRFLAQSLQTTKKAFSWKVEDMMPPTQKLLFQFSSECDFKKWSAYSDREHGGLSSASLTKENSHAVFFGNMSTQLSENATLLKKSGFAGIRTFQEESIYDLGDFDTLEFRIKGDGHTYISSLRTEGWVGSPFGTENNTWQTFLTTPRDEWKVVQIPLDGYLPTWKGKIIGSNITMNPSRIVGFGISLVSTKSTVEIESEPFRLEVDWIRACRTDS